MVGRGSGQPWTTGIPALSVDGRAFYINDSDFTLEPRVDGRRRRGRRHRLRRLRHLGTRQGARRVRRRGREGQDRARRSRDRRRTRRPPAACSERPLTRRRTTKPWADESKDAGEDQDRLRQGSRGHPPVRAREARAARPMAAPQALSQAQIMAMMGGAQAPAEPYTRPFLVVTDVSERVFRHAMFRDPQESPRGFIARMDQWRRDIRDRQGALGGDRGQRPGERLHDDDLLQRQAEEQHLAQRGRQGGRHRPEAQGAGHRRRRSPRSRRA